MTILFVPLSNADFLDEKLNVSITLNQPTLIIEIIEDHVDLGDITKGYVSEARPFNVTNKGTVDATIQPQISSPDEIFSNLWIGATKGGIGTIAGYKKIGEFIGNVSKSSTYGGEEREDFWIKLNLEDYNGGITGNLVKEVTFWVMPA